MRSGADAIPNQAKPACGERHRARVSEPTEPGPGGIQDGVAPQNERTHMSRTRILASLAAAALGIATLGACSTESLTERAVSFGLEQAIEGNEDINLDFGDDGSGGFSISTEEGDFAISFDEDNGGITFDTEDGAGAISFDEDGIVFDTDEGDGVISFDEENGEIVFETDAGDGVISFDEDNGTVNFEGDAGSAAFGTNDVPDSWPAAIGVPQTVNSDTMVFTEVDTGEGKMLIGTFYHAAGDPFAANTADALLAAGWTMTSGSADADYMTFGSGASTATILVLDADATTVSLMIGG